MDNHRALETPLDLYEQLVNWLVIRIDNQKGDIRHRFKVDDPDGSLKLGVLTELAFTRLFQERQMETRNRLIFTKEEIRQCAKAYLKSEKPAEYHALAKDVIVTPLLREAAPGTYAFIHLTILEYLAAKRLASHQDVKKLFVQAYLDQTLVEMLVLPMAIGSDSETNRLLTLLDGLPESLTWTKMRLRARSLAYRRSVGSIEIEGLITALTEIIIAEKLEYHPYREHLLRSFNLAFQSNFAEAMRQRVVANILPFVTHEIWQVRRDAVQALGKCGVGKDIIDGLSSTFEMENVARHAVRALGQLGGKDALLTLFQALTHRNVFARREAAEVLGEVGGEEAMEPLLNAITDPDSEVRRESASKLNGSLSRLKQKLRDPDPVIRRAAVEALTKQKGIEVADYLAEHFSDSDADVRRTVAMALGKSTSKKVVPPLIRYLSDPIVSVKLAAIGSLEELADHDCSNHLVQLLADPDPDVRKAALRPLGRLRSPDVTGSLLPFLNDPEANVRGAAVDALSDNGDVAAVQPLILALDDPDRLVSSGAAYALGQLGKEHAAEVLLQALSHQNNRVRKVAAHYLGEWKILEATVPLIKVLCDRGAKGNSGKALDPQTIQCRMKDADGKEMREAAAKALGNLGSNLPG